MRTTAQMMFGVLRHPFDFFEEIQKPNRIRWRDAIIVVLLAYVARMLSLVLTGYAFETREPYEISYFHEFVWIVVPWFTWCVSNWGVSAILDGEGKFKEVVVGSAFALVPYTLFIVPITLLTFVFSLQEYSTYSFLVNAVLVWTVWLLLLKVKKIHDFEFGKLVFITLLSMIGIAILWFIGILMFGLINQLIQFIIELFREMNFRR
ncbi:Yip1 family protein [Paenibacillus sp. Marseille-Q4541]|uniref:Yip1 family protein n=1 Tax=Paenibacillus sp. Marseille-Q4541 TaxID=2831522 RepID=UPI001BA861CD|nr:Yip1 family protein [Paenibacillus sp. Marseille-Q4541]